MNWYAFFSAAGGGLLAGLILYGVDHWLRQRRSESAWERERGIYTKQIEDLYADNRDLRDRMFQSKGFAPTGIDSTEKYIETQAEKKEQTEKVRKNGKPPVGPLEKRVAQWTKEDRADKERGVDVTSIH